jgi:hypothetical protein
MTRYLAPPDIPAGELRQLESVTLHRFPAAAQASAANGHAVSNSGGPAAPRTRMSEPAFLGPWGEWRGL